MEPPIPGYYQYFWGVNVSCSKKQTHRPGRGSNPGLPINYSSENGHLFCGKNAVYCTVMPPKTYFIRALCKEEAEDHDIGEWQEKVDMGIILVLLHKECCSEIESIIMWTSLLSWSFRSRSENESLGHYFLQFSIKWASSWENRLFAYAKTKTQISFSESNREANQRLCFRYIYTTMPLPSKSEISSF